MKKYVTIILLVICCVAGCDNLCDKFLIPRFVISALCLLAVFVDSFLNNKTFQIPKSISFYSYLAFIVWAGLSIIWSINYGEAMFQEWQYFMGFMVVVVFFNLLMDNYHTTLKMLWYSSAIILIIYLSFAIIQIAGLDEISWVQLYHVSGINTHKNHLSAMLFMLASFLLTALYDTNSKFLKTFLLALISISFSVIFFLKSRAVLLGMVVSIVAFIVIYCIHIRRPRISLKLKLVTVILSIILSLLYFTVLIRNYTSSIALDSYEKSEAQINISSTSSLNERFILWNKTYHIVDKKPLLGCGTGNWQICFPEVGLNGLNQMDYWNVNFTKPHNEYLGILAENGYLGLVLYLTFICSIVICSGFVIIEIKDKKEFLFGAIIVSIICGCCINAIFDFHNSRIEYLVLISVFYATLFCFISNNNDVKKTTIIDRSGSIILIVLASWMVMVGIIRFKGEYETVKMQRALYHEDWDKVEQYSIKAISKYYSVDSFGMPIYWYHGQAQKAMGKPQSIFSFRQAFKAAPFCKENLNDLAVDEYYIMGNCEQAKNLLNEAIYISPHYIYPYLNLTAIYIGENNLCKAKKVIEIIDFDDIKRDFLKEEARYFNPFSAEMEQQKIDKDFEDLTELHHVVDSLLIASGISCN